jgi:hypothetical protein
MWVMARQRVSFGFDLRLIQAWGATVAGALFMESPTTWTLINLTEQLSIFDQKEYYFRKGHQ